MAEVEGRVPLTNKQMDAIATAVDLFPGIFSLGEARVKDRATCDSLVERGSLVTVDPPEDGDQDASWYRLSDELAMALAIKVDQSLVEAALN